MSVPETAPHRSGERGWAQLSASLFDDVRRDDVRPARFDEPTFRFLNRRSGASWQRVRDLLDEWFGRISDEATAADLRSRLQSETAFTFRAAFFELYCHEALRRSGWDLEHHPVLAHTRKHPDLRLAQDGITAAYAEVTTTAKDRLDEAAEARLNSVVDAINDRLQIDHFMLGIEVLKVGSDAPATRPLCGKLQEWLSSLDAYSRFEDPVIRDHDARACLLRMAGQQMTWQGLESHALARTAAIFTQTSQLKPAKYLRPGWDAEVFGCSLQEYVGTVQLVWASAVKCEGRFDLTLFDTPDGTLISRHLSRDTVTRVLDTHFATSTAEFRNADEVAVGRTGRDDELRRYTYNPLRGRPLLTGFGVDYLCPMPQLAWAKATPWGIYFSLLDHFGPEFAPDLGNLFEQYIGRQLQLLPSAQVLPEITYGPKKGRRETVDWIVVLPEVVLLVEVKSAIPTEPVRLGTPDAADAIVSKLGKAVNQIDATAQLIADRDDAVAAVPPDRPVLGLVVTLEPFHIANAFSLLPAGRTPVTVVDAAEIEVLVTITDTPPGQLLLDRASDDVRFTHSLDTALYGHEHDRNPILDQAWSSYPWASAGRDSQ